MRTTHTMRAIIGALCAMQTIATVPVAAAVPGHDRPTATALEARELSRTIGGLEARLTNIPVSGGGLGVLPLPADNRVDLELVTSLWDAPVNNFTVTATVNSAVSVPVTFVSKANVGTGSNGGGTSLFYNVNVGAACTPGEAVILHIRGAFANTFHAETSRWVRCS